MILGCERIRTIFPGCWTSRSGVKSDGGAHTVEVSALTAPSERAQIRCVELFMSEYPTRPIGFPQAGRVILLAGWFGKRETAEKSHQCPPSHPMSHQTGTPSSF